MMHIRGVEMYNMDVYMSPRRLEKMNGIQRIDPIHKNQQDFFMKNEIKKDQNEFVFKPVRVKPANDVSSGTVGIQVRLMHKNDQMIFNASVNAKLAYTPKEEASGKNFDYMI
ncbi:hypothetical protein [Anaerosolibacter sp.]|uniref:hypothetical protein n=1 Tax=Anaerosolibacter sp. TaxID=1872527 RepID=UPI0039F00688